MKRMDSHAESLKVSEDKTQQLPDKDQIRKTQFYSKCIAEKLFVYGVVLRKNRTARVRRIEDNKQFLRGIF